MPISLQFTDHGIEGVVPLELLPPHVRSKYEGKANDRSKRAKKEDSKVAQSHAEENQVSKPTFSIQILNSFIYIFFSARISKITLPSVANWGLASVLSSTPSFISSSQNNLFTLKFLF